VKPLDFFLTKLPSSPLSKDDEVRPHAAANRSFRVLQLCTSDELTVAFQHSPARLKVGVTRVANEQRREPGCLPYTACLVLMIRVHSIVCSVSLALFFSCLA